MKITQTGIAVALALVVIVILFILPGFSPFGSLAPASSESAAVTQADVQNNPNSSTAMPTVDSLQISDISVGTGETAAKGDNVTVNYVGALTNGKIFDASANHGTTGFAFTLGAGQVIKGWDQGVAGMKVGGKRQLVIPASLAYGDQAIGNVIPANSTLVFQVELLKVEKPK